MPVDVSFLSAFNGDQFFTANGDVNIGGSVLTLFEDTTTPCNTYTDVTGLVLNPNPLVVNVDGFLDTEIWTPVGSNVRIQVYDAANTLLQDKDNIPGVPFLSQDLTQVFVIDSVFSTDTANAASANAANWLYKIANAAFGFANTNANNISNVSANLTGLSSNTIIVKAGGATINVGNTINFQNTAFANIAVTPFGTDGVNVAIFANATTSGTTSNSSTVINGFIFQWASYTHTASGEAGPFTDDFPVAFPNGCLSVQLTTQGGPGAAGLVVSSFTRSAFTWYTQFAGAGTTGQYLFAIGY
jgi:hypothetical protein